MVQFVRRGSHLDTHRLVNRFSLLRGRRGYYITLATLIIPDNRTLLVSQSIPNASRRQPHVQTRQAMTQMAYQTERHKAQGDMSLDTGRGPMIDRSYSQIRLR
ncbi:MAG: hypothetical protein OXC02_01460, partial [Rhodobacteraceae bacterium]|nr:hypothetical protein [Paracoccaceae bacterium]